jgi:signal peptidase
VKITALTVAEVGRSILAALIVLPLIVAFSLAVIHAQGHKLLSVQTASMLPSIRPGDALIIAPAQPNQLHIGDIVSYHDQHQPRMIISHRLVSVDPKTGWLTTAGDALHSPDPTFPPNQIVGHATAIAPKLGFVLDSLRRPVGLILTIYLPAMLIIISEANHLMRFYARPFYSARL